MGFGPGTLDFSCRLGREFHERVESAAGLFGDAGFDVMAEADEADDGGGFHEVEMAAVSREEGPCAIAEGRGGTEGDEEVHVGAAGFQLPPRPAIEGGAGENLDQCCQREREPWKPGRLVETKDPFANHQEEGHDYTQPKSPLPISFGRFVAGVIFNDLRIVAGFFDGDDDGVGIFLDGGLP